MKRLILILALLATPACHPPSTITTGPAQIAFSADQVTIRVNELQNAAIAAEANGSLPTATARTIVQFAVSADKTLATTPAGWQATLQTAWAQVKAQVGTISNPTVALAFGAADAIISVLGGQ